MLNPDCKSGVILYVYFCSTIWFRQILHNYKQSNRKLIESRHKDCLKPFWWIVWCDSWTVHDVMILKWYQLNGKTVELTIMSTLTSTQKLAWNKFLLKLNFPRSCTSPLTDLCYDFKVSTKICFAGSLKKYFIQWNATSVIAYRFLPVAIRTQCHQITFQDCWSVSIIYRIYANIPRIFFPEFSEEKLGCTHYLKQGWYSSASKQMIPSRVKEWSANHVWLQDLVITRSRQKKNLG